MAEETHAVLCASCGVTPEPVSDADDALWRCPKCGNSDTADAILEEAQAHAFEAVQDGLGDGLQDLANKSGGLLKFERAQVERRKYRWVTEFKA